VSEPKTKLISCKEPEVCAICKKIVTKKLDLHHTTTTLCSFECETSFWLDVFY